MKAAAILIILLAAVTGVIPQFTDCQSQGKAIELAAGKSIPMKCHWTARAEIALAAPLLVCGAFLLFGRRPEALRQAAVLSMVLGLLVVLMPTVLIGVCAKPDMLCRALMKPALCLVGVGVAVLGIVCVVLSGRRDKQSK